MTRYAKILAILCILFCCLGLASMFLGAYLHDHFHTLTKDQVFIAPMIFILVSLITLVLGWIEEQRHD